MTTDCPSHPGAGEATQVAAGRAGAKPEHHVHGHRGRPGPIAVVVFIHGAHTLVLAPHSEPFAVHDHRAVNSATFIVVILELVGTIVARPEEGGFQLQPFLMIGIISATRDILTVDAELSLAGDQQAPLAHDDRTRRQRRGGGRAVGRPGAGATFRAPRPCLRAIP